MDTHLVKAVARSLRYRSLDHLIGRPVEIRDIGRVEEAVRSALGPDLPDGCRLAGPEPIYRHGAVAKYGILDLVFSVPGEMPIGDVRGGLALLHDLGFLPGGDGPQHRVCDDPLCLEMLQEELDEGRVWLLLFLEGGRPDGSRVEDADGQVDYRIPEGYLPRPFLVVDACLTNARSVWLWKHFYV
jgi:hypothetical protein